MKNLAAGWRSLIGRVGIVPWWALIWLGSLLVPFLPLTALIPVALGTWISAIMLAPGRRAGYRLLKMATIFLVIWATLTAIIHLINPTSLRPVGNLTVWLALGLNLMLAKTPLELALTAAHLLTPLLGRLRAQKLTLALALLARLIPRLLSSAIDINTTVQRRAASLPLQRRLILLAQTLLRDSFSQNEELSRALLKRWPWDCCRLDNSTLNNENTR